MKVIRIGLFALMATVGGAALAIAQDNPAPAAEGQPATPPDRGGNTGTEPGGTGSTGWTGGTGGQSVDPAKGDSAPPEDSKAGPNSQTAPGQPEVVEGANPDPK